MEELVMQMGDLRRGMLRSWEATNLARFSCSASILGTVVEPYCRNWRDFCLPLVTSVQDSTL